MPPPTSDAPTDAQAAAAVERLEGEVEYACTVALDAFSGPLDLLLFLVRRAEVDVVDIPIAEIADQFIATVAAWADCDLDEAGEFIVMAATLLEIKARLIAPPPEAPVEGEEAEEPVIDLRAGLVAKLLAYRAFKEAALDLAEREEEHAFRQTRQLHEDIPEDPEEAEGIDLENADPYALAAAWETVLMRITGLGPRTVSADPVPIEVAIADVMDTVRARGHERLSRLFSVHPTKIGRVTTLMATLEVTRQRYIESLQHGQYEDVDLRWRAEEERPVITHVFEPEAESKGRRKRPPLLTWEPAPGAAAATDEPESTDDEPGETDEQRFLRELEAACAVDAVLGTCADIENGFARYWAEKRGLPWPPPAPVAPPPPPVAAAAPAPSAPPPRQRPQRAKTPPATADQAEASTQPAAETVTPAAETTTPVSEATAAPEATSAATPAPAESLAPAAEGITAQDAPAASAEPLAPVAEVAPAPDTVTASAEVVAEAPTAAAPPSVAAVEALPVESAAPTETPSMDPVPQLGDGEEEEAEGDPELDPEEDEEDEEPEPGDEPFVPESRRSQPELDEVLAALAAEDEDEDALEAEPEAAPAASAPLAELVAEPAASAPIIEADESPELEPTAHAAAPEPESIDVPEPSPAATVPVDDRVVDVPTVPEPEAPVVAESAAVADGADPGILAPALTTTAQATAEQPPAATTPPPSAEFPVAAVVEPAPRTPEAIEDEAISAPPVAAAADPVAPPEASRAIEPTPVTTPVLAPEPVRAISLEHQTHEPTPVTTSVLPVEPLVVAAATTDPAPMVDRTPLTAAVLAAPAQRHAEPIAPAAIAPEVPVTAAARPLASEPEIAIAPTAPRVAPAPPRAPLADRSQPSPPATPSARTRGTTLHPMPTPAQPPRRRHLVSISATLALVALGWWLARGDGEPTRAPATASSAAGTLAPPAPDLTGGDARPASAPMGVPAADEFARRLLAAQAAPDLARWLDALDGRLVERLPATPDTAPTDLPPSDAPLDATPAEPTSSAPAPAADGALADLLRSLDDGDLIAWSAALAGEAVAPLGPVASSAGTAATRSAEPSSAGKIEVGAPAAAPADPLAPWRGALGVGGDIAGFGLALAHGLSSVLVAAPAPAAETDRAFPWQHEPMLSPSAWLVIWSWEETAPAGTAAP